MTGALLRKGCATAMMMSLWPRPLYNSVCAFAPSFACAAARAVPLRGLTVVSALPVSSSIGGASLRAKVIGWLGVGSGIWPKAAFDASDVKGRKS